MKNVQIAPHAEHPRPCKVRSSLPQFVNKCAARDLEALPPSSRSLPSQSLPLNFMPCYKIFQRRTYMMSLSYIRFDPGRVPISRSSRAHRIVSGWTSSIRVSNDFRTFVLYETRVREREGLASIILQLLITRFLKQRFVPRCAICWYNSFPTHCPLWCIQSTRQ